jgi:hypothetical protein
VTRAVLAPLAVAAAAATAGAVQQPAGGPGAILASEAAGIRVHYVPIPWGPETFAEMERGGESYYNRRSWPFARLETEAPLTLDGTRVPPGNYALVFHPNDAERKGMSLEMRRIDVPEFLQPGNALTPTPDGSTVHKAPVAFETVPDTVSTLAVSLEDGDRSARLVVRYGNRRLAKELKR